MCKKILTITVTIIAALATFVIPLSVTAVSGQTIVNLTNQTRAVNGLARLTWSGELANSAWLKAQDICNRQYWAHTAPDGTTAWQLMSLSGYDYVTAGENLAKGFVDDSGVMSGWMASTGHRANILNGTFTEIGVGAATCTMDGLETTVVVAHYGASAGAASSTAPEAAKAPVVQPTAQAVDSLPTAETESAQPVVPQAPKESLGALIWRLSTATYHSLFID